MKKSVFLLVGLTFWVLQLSAAPRTYQQARSLAQRQAVSLGIPVTDQGITHSRVAPLGEAETSSYYVFNNGEDRGFTIVSGDDRMPDIVGYATQGHLTQETAPVQLLDFLKSYELLSRAVEAGVPAALKAVAEKKALLNGFVPAKVEPLLGGIQWGQDAPFNALCPKFGGENAVTGCVATAMSQVMAMYRHPASLQAEIPAYVTTSKKASVSAIPAGETYDFDHILPSYDGGYTEEEGAAVAKLVFHCGAAVKMDYAVEGSGAHNESIVKALTSYFGYDADVVQYLYRDAFTLVEWNTILQNELSEGRPVVYSGNSLLYGGHAFVCDGSDGQGLYHINWGWSGFANGYFDISILNDEYASSTSSPDGYNRYADMIIGIRPDNGVKDDPIVKNNPVVSNVTLTLDNSFRQDESGRFGLTAEIQVGNRQEQDFDGYVALQVRDANGFTFLTEKKRVKVKGCPDELRFYYTTFSTGISYAFPVGISRVQVMSSVDGTDFEPCSAAYTFSPKAYVEATETQVRHSVGASLTAELTNARQVVYSGTDNTLSLSLTNHGPFDFKDVVSVYTSATGTKPKVASYDILFDIESNGVSVRDVTVRPTSAGKIYVWVDNSLGESLVSAQAFDVEATTTPVLTLTSLTTNAVPNLYEMENAYMISADKKVRVKAPATEDPEAVFNFTVGNTGGFTNRVFYVYVYGKSEQGSVRRFDFRESFDTNEEKTFTVTVSEEDVNARFVEAAIYMYDEGDGVTLNLSEALEQPRLYVVTDDGRVTGGYYYNSPNCAYLYIRGVKSGIESVREADSMVAGEGHVTLCLRECRQVAVYNLNGQVLKKVSVAAGQPQTISLAPGVYVIDGTKVLVR